MGFLCNTILTITIFGISDIDIQKVCKDQQKIAHIEPNDDLIVLADHCLVLLHQFHAELVNKGGEVAIEP